MRVEIWIRCVGMAVVVALSRGLGAETTAPTADAYRVVRDQTYVVREEMALTSDVYLPEVAGPYPGVLIVHGGAWAAGHKNFAAWHARRLAQRGFAVMSINYRLAPRYPFPAQLEDCRAALDWMAAQADRFQWDITRCAAYGYSAGGHLACLLGLTETKSARGKATDNAQPPRPIRLRAIVAGGAPCDFQNEPVDSQRLAFWLGGTRRARPEAYRAASPLDYVSSQAPPIFFFHGARDRVVPIASPRRLFERLRTAGVATQLHVVPQAGHLGAYLDRQAFEQSVKFLKRQLAGDAGE